MFASDVFVDSNDNVGITYDLTDSASCTSVSHFVLPIPESCVDPQDVVVSNCSAATFDFSGGPCFPFDGFTYPLLKIEASNQDCDTVTVTMPGAALAEHGPFGLKAGYKCDTCNTLVHQCGPLLTPPPPSPATTSSTATIATTTTAPPTPTPECTIDKDCEDFNSCTNDQCELGVCWNMPLPTLSPCTDFALPCPSGEGVCDNNAQCVCKPEEPTPGPTAPPTTTTTTSASTTTTLTPCIQAVCDDRFGFATCQPPQTACAPGTFLVNTPNLVGCGACVCCSPEDPSSPTPPPTTTPMPTPVENRCTSSADCEDFFPNGGECGYQCVNGACVAQDNNALCPDPIDDDCERLRCREGECVTVNLQEGTQCNSPDPCPTIGVCNNFGDCLCATPAPTPVSPTPSPAVACYHDADCESAFSHYEAGECGYKCDKHEGVCVLADNDHLCPQPPSDSCTEVECHYKHCVERDLPSGEPCRTDVSQLLSVCDGRGECVEPCVPDDACSRAVVLEGECRQMPISCDDNNVCTNDTCDPELGCQYERVDIDDGDVCTIDYCDEVAGPQHTSLQCEAPDRCSTAECVAMPVNGSDPLGPTVGVCKVTPLNLNDGDPCTLDMCDPETGPRYTHIPECRQCTTNEQCDDDNVCTSESCANGVCIYTDVPMPAISNATNLCLRGVCDRWLGYIEVELSCEVDTRIDVANGGHSAHYDHPTHGLDHVYADHCSVHKCNPESGECERNEIDCSSEDKCINTFCDMSVNKCQRTPVQCTPDDECHEAHCDSALGCVQTPILVKPPNACQTARCIAGRGIVHRDRNCTDADACTVDSCNEFSGCTHTPMRCEDDDDDKCTINARCEDGACVSDERECPQPANPCEEAYCDRHKGCQVREVFCPPSPDLRFVAQCDPSNGECLSVIKDCDDQDPCTVDIVRINGDCKHTEIDGCCRENDDCPRGNKCVSFSCDLNTNECVTRSERNCCNADDDCDDGLACTADHCQVTTGTCFNSPIECNAPLNNKCVEAFCSEEQGGECVTRRKTCDDGDSCTRDDCVESTGECTHEMAIKCSDGNLCTHDQCVGEDAEPRCEFLDCNCDDSNPCTEDRCDPRTGECLFEPLGAIDDNNACTKDTCRPRRQRPDLPLIEHAPISCDDGMPCTNDTCNPIKGCIHTPIDYSHLEEDICISISCNPLTGDPMRERIQNCCHNDAECHARGFTCTDEYCDLNTNRCVFSPKQDCCNIDKDCNDNNKCTTDSCKRETGECCNEPIECVPPDDCHIAECHPLHGCVITEKDCSDGDPCTIDSCNAEAGGVCVNEPMQCEQPINPCDREQVCELGECVDAALATCDDQDPCTDDSCEAVWVNNRAKAICSHTPCDCDDHDDCTVDSCDADGNCQHQRLPADQCCNADNECAPWARNKCERARCVPSDEAGVGGSCFIEKLEDCCESDADCADDDLCTSNESCCPETHTCTAQYKVCDDWNPRTRDTCNPTTGQCEHRKIVCDDNKACTRDYFDAVSESCVHEPLTRPPDAPPPADKCVTYTCTELSGFVERRRDCDDGNTATDDYCDPVSGDCEHTPVICDDNNACTRDSFSSLLNGCVHERIECGSDDDDKCKIWLCDKWLGCQHKARHCRAPDACQAATCVSSKGCVFEDIECNDNDPCTDDWCDASQGGCVFEPNGQCQASASVAAIEAEPKNAETDKKPSAVHQSTQEKALLEKLRHIHEKQSALHEEKREAGQLERAMHVSDDDDDDGVPAACGDGIVQSPEEECDGTSQNTLFQECDRDTCQFSLRSGVIASWIAVGSLILGACGCLVSIVLCPPRRRKNRSSGSRYKKMQKRR